MNKPNRPFINLVLPILGITIGVLILESLHIHNEFPLLLADSKGYIMLGLKFVENSHWSNTYIYFVGKNIQLFNTLNWIPIIQNTLIVSVLYLFVQTLYDRTSLLRFSSLILLLLFTSLPWMSNVIMSDISTPICLLIILIFFNYNLSLSTSLFLSIVFFFTASWHQSHIAIIPLFSSVVILSRLIIGERKLKVELFEIAKKSSVLLILLIASFLMEKNILNQPQTEIENQKNFKAVGKSKSKTSDITSGYYFIGVRMWEVGELDNLLEKYCPENPNNYLCDPNNSFKITVKLNRGLDRTQSNDEYQKFSRDNKDFVMSCLLYPRFYYAVVKAAIKRSPRLLSKTIIPSFNPQTGKTFERNIRKISNKQRLSYKGSSQMNWKYRDTTKYEKVSNKSFYDIYKIVDKIWWFMILPGALLFYFFTLKQFPSIILLTKKKVAILTLLIIGHIINTIICGTFSNADNVRYNSRTMWLVHLAIIFFIFFVMEAKRKTSTSHYEANRPNTVS